MESEAVVRPPHFFYVHSRSRNPEKAEKNYGTAYAPTVQCVNGAVMYDEKTIPDVSRVMWTPAFNAAKGSCEF